MSPDFEYQKGRSDERAAVVAFLRKRTNLSKLAEILERGIHVASEKEQNDFAARNQVGTLR